MARVLIQGVVSGANLRITPLPLRRKTWLSIALILAVMNSLVACGGKKTKSAGFEVTLAHPPTTEVTTQLKLRLPENSGAFRERVAQEKIRFKFGITRFYQQHLHQPAWITDEGALPRVQALLQIIRESKADGFSPESFHLSAIQLLLEDLERRKKLQIAFNFNRLSDLEILLTDAFLALCNHFQTGIVPPKQSGYEWYIPREDVQDPVKVLSEVIDTNRVGETLRAMLPQHPDYKRLRLALSEYRKIARNGGWNLIPPGKALRIGDRDRRVPLLRRRLRISRDLPRQNQSQGTDPKLLDEALGLALKKFQERHGLAANGVLNRRTLSALNVSAQKRVRRILVNMERWRWLQRDFGSRYVSVNIADFQLKAVDHEKTILQMPVIVGNLYKQTPVFTGSMTYVVLNPYWFVPKNIVIESLLPKIKKDPKYLEKNHFTLMRQAPGKEWEKVEPPEIDWEQVAEDGNFELSLRRDPGPDNPLGQVKFMFPNRFSIYLHDTPEKDLFKKGVRTLSSGCIRVARPLDLLEFVLRENTALSEPPWTMERVQQELKRDPKKIQETQIRLLMPVPVHMLYLTAWADESGQAHFRDDVYGRDELLDQFF